MHLITNHRRVQALGQTDCGWKNLPDVTEHLDLLPFAQLWRWMMLSFYTVFVAAGVLLWMS